MASIRKRTLPGGGTRWGVDYKDAAGRRRNKLFATKREADAHLRKIGTELDAGTHVHDRDAVTIEKAYNLLIATLEEEQEAGDTARATVEGYRWIWRNHIGPFIGKRLCTKMQPPDVQEFLAELKAEGRNDDIRRRAKIALAVIFDHAVNNRLAHSNPARLSRGRRKGRRAGIKKVAARPTIPEREDVARLLSAAGKVGTYFLIARRRHDGGQMETIAIEETQDLKHVRRHFTAFRKRHADVDGIEFELFRPAPWLRPLIATLAFSGIRIGEARGIAWGCVHPGALEVEMAVDRFNSRDSVKTDAAVRRVPIGDFLAATLATWRGTVERSPEALVYPSDEGTPISYANVANRQFGPVQVVTGMTDAAGRHRFTPHDLRHFAVSLWIAEGADPKLVSERTGHESVAFTLSTYAHLFARQRDDRTAANAGERSVIALLA